MALHPRLYICGSTSGFAHGSSAYGGSARSSARSSAYGGTARSSAYGGSARSSAYGGSTRSSIYKSSARRLCVRRFCPILLGWRKAPHRALYPYRLQYFMHFLLDKGYFMLAYLHYPKPHCLLQQ